jgi:hypothetical protein
MNFLMGLISKLLKLCDDNLPNRAMLPLTFLLLHPDPNVPHHGGRKHLYCLCEESVAPLKRSLCLLHTHSSMTSGRIARIEAFMTSTGVLP